MEKNFYACITLLLVTFVAIPAIAQEETEDHKQMFDEAKAFYEAGEYQKAKVMFQKLFKLVPGDKNINFHLGLAAEKLGDYETSSMAYDRILIMNPELNTVRVELAKSYYKLGLYDMALIEFKDVADDKDLPQNVAMNVNLFMEKIKILKAKANRKHYIGGVLSLAGTIDSNVAQAPSSEAITLPNLVNALSVPTIKDEYMSSSLILNYEYRPVSGRFNWNATFVNYNTWYDEMTNLDISSYNLQTGPRLFFSDLTLDLNILGAYMSKDDLDYMQAYGFITNIVQKLSNTAMLTTNMKIEEQSYYQDPNNTGTLFTSSIGPTFIFDRDIISIFAGFEANNVKSESESYRKFFALCNYSRIITKDVSVHCNYNYTRSFYDKPDLLMSLKKRQDDVHRISLGVSKSFKSGFTLEANYAYSRAYSTVDLNDYYKHVGTITLNYIF